MNVDRVTRPDFVDDVVDVSIVGMARWEFEALAQLLDGAEPETAEQAHVLRALRLAVPIPSTRVRQ